MDPIGILEEPSNSSGEISINAISEYELGTVSGSRIFGSSLGIHRTHMDPRKASRFSDMSDDDREISSESVRLTPIAEESLLIEIAEDSTLQTENEMPEKISKNEYGEEAGEEKAPIEKNVDAGKKKKKKKVWFQNKIIHMLPDYPDMSRFFRKKVKKEETVAHDLKTELDEEIREIENAPEKTPENKTFVIPGVGFYEKKGDAKADANSVQISPVQTLHPLLTPGRSEDLEKEISFYKEKMADILFEENGEEVPKAHRHTIAEYRYMHHLQESKKKNQELKDELKKEEKLKSVIKKRFDQLHAEHIALEDHHSEISSELKNTTKCVETMIQNVTALEETIERNDMRTKALEIEVEALKTSENKKVQEITELGNENCRLVALSKETQAENTSMLEEIASLKKRLKQTEAQLLEQDFFMAKLRKSSTAHEFYNYRSRDESRDIEGI